MLEPSHSSTHDRADSVAIDNLGPGSVGSMLGMEASEIDAISSDSNEEATRQDIGKRIMEQGNMGTEEEHRDMGRMVTPPHMEDPSGDRSKAQSAFSVLERDHAQAVPLASTSPSPPAHRDQAVSLWQGPTLTLPADQKSSCPIPSPGRQPVRKGHWRREPATGNTVQ